MAPSKTFQDNHLHIFFFPFLASGHIVPLLEMARLFAERGVKVSYVTTPGNVHLVRHSVDEAVESGLSMQVLLLPFPSEQDVGLPAGCENTNALPMRDGAVEKFYHVIQLLRRPLEELVRDHRPDCLVADQLYPWSSDLAISFGIPRIVFEATSHFNVCISEQIEHHDAHLGVASDTEPFIVPGDLPHKIQLTKAELHKIFHCPKWVLDMYRESERKSYGVVMNGFDELAPEYAVLLKKDGRRIWNVGPVCLCNRNAALAGRAGGNGRANDDDIKRWLDERDDGSVLYVAFGSECVFSSDQLRELALGLEASGRPFIWVVRGSGGGLDTIAEWLPEGFEQRVEDRGKILKRWAPQMLILNQPAVGGFLTHCGWGSITEALTAGVPMVAWPLYADQFISERLVVQVLGVGVTVLEGVRRTIYAEQKEVVKAEAVKVAVDRVMGDGNEAREIRKRANNYKELSRAAVVEGGSSYANLTSMIEGLSALAVEKREAQGLY